MARDDLGDDGPWLGPAARRPRQVDGEKDPPSGACARDPCCLCVAFYDSHIVSISYSEFGLCVPPRCGPHARARLHEAQRSGLSKIGSADNPSRASWRWVTPLHRSVVHRRLRRGRRIGQGRSWHTATTANAPRARATRKSPIHGTGRLNNRRVLSCSMAAIHIQGLRRFGEGLVNRRASAAFGSAARKRLHSNPFSAWSGDDAPFVLTAAG